MGPNQPRLLALSLEAKQGLFSLRSAFTEGTLTPEALARAVSRLTSIKSRALSIHGEFEAAGSLSTSRLADARRHFGSIWASVRGMHTTLSLAHRELGLVAPRPTRIDATWGALKSKFVAGWPRLVLPPAIVPTPPRVERDAVVPAVLPSGAELGGLSVLPGARCPVCAGERTAESIDCPRCGAVHHRECWDYAGGCGIYGCRRAARP